MILSVTYLAEVCGFSPLYHSQREVDAAVPLSPSLFSIYYQTMSYKEDYLLQPDVSKKELR